MSGRRQPVPVAHVPIHQSASAQKHRAAVQYYNDQIARKVAAGQFKPESAPYANSITAPDDLMALAHRQGIDFGADAPAERGLHSGSGSVNPFNRPTPGVSTPGGAPNIAPGHFATTLGSWLPSSALAGGLTGGMNSTGATLAATLGTTDATPGTAAVTRSPSLDQIIQPPPLPPDVALTVDAQ